MLTSTLRFSMVFLCSIWAAEGRAYALYPPNGGTVLLPLEGNHDKWDLHWIDIESGEWGPKEKVSMTPDLEITSPGNGNWAAALIPGL